MKWKRLLKFFDIRKSSRPKESGTIRNLDSELVSQAVKLAGQGEYADAFAQYLRAHDLDLPIVSQPDGTTKFELKADFKDQLANLLGPPGKQNDNDSITLKSAIIAFVQEFHARFIREGNLKDAEAIQWWVLEVFGPSWQVKFLCRELLEQKLNDRDFAKARKALSYYSTESDAELQKFNLFSCAIDMDERIRSAVTATSTNFREARKLLPTEAEMGLVSKEPAFIYFRSMVDADILFLEGKVSEANEIWDCCLAAQDIARESKEIAQISKIKYHLFMNDVAKAKEGLALVSFEKQENPHFKLLRGWIATEDGLFKTAEAMINDGLSGDLKSIYSKTLGHLLLARLQVRQNNATQAAFHRKVAREISPDYPESIVKVISLDGKED